MKTKLFITIIAFATIVACNKDNQPTRPQKSEQEIAVENLISKCQDFDTESIIQGLPGAWLIDSEIYYCDDWQKITTTNMFMGSGFAYNQSYYFSSDGKGFFYIPEDLFLGVEEILNHFDWSYDAEKKELIINYENSESVYVAKVTGFNGEYLVIDGISSVYTPSKGEWEDFNCRHIYKLKVE